MTKKLQCYIVDDEPRAVNTLSYLIENYCADQASILGSTNKYEEALQFLQQNKPDVLFLDIKLGNGKTGFDLLRDLGHLGNIQVIMTTAYDEFAIEAFKHGAANYLLKPINPDDLKLAIDRIEKLPKQKELTQESKLIRTAQDRLFLPDRKGWNSFLFKDIVFLKAENVYTHIHLDNQPTEIISKSLGFIEQNHLVNNKSFIRVQKSYIVNVQHIVRINKQDSGFLEMSNGLSVPISIQMKKEIFEILTGEHV